MKEYILVSHQIPEKVCDTLIENATNWEKHPQDYIFATHTLTTSHEI